MGKARKARTARKVKTTVVNVLSYSDPSSTSQSHANSVTKSKRAGELRVEADAARTKRTRFLQTQTSGVRAAANAVVTVSGAQADDDAPAYGNGAFGYEDDLGWEDDDDEEEEEEEELEITHAGGEVRDLHVHVVRYMARPGRTRKRGRAILQERRARLEWSTRSWKNQMEALVDQYLEWKAGDSEQGTEMDVDTHGFEVTSIHTSSRIRRFLVLQKPNELANVALLRNGLLGCSPTDPAVAISLNTLELYHRLRRRCGQLSIQCMARTLCDLHNHTYLTYHRDQFSITFDVYLDILRRVKLRTDAVLGRDTPNWRALNACPPCTYELEDEVPLVPRAMHVVDGNYSYKRAANAGLVDQREFESDYIMSRAQVNRFQYEVKSRAREGLAEGCDEEIECEDEEAGEPYLIGPDNPGDPADGQDAETPCTKNWRAAQEKQSALDIYDINGGLPMACRHGIIEVFCEIVRSGELAKYPLAATDFLLQVYGRDQVLGFDIGCSFESTLRNSPMLGTDAKAKGLQVIVNAFHGWAHNRLCQLKYHPAYRTGMGLEDLESLERFFSSSNTIARTIRHATKFHWHQAVDLHFRQWGEEKYQELSNFFINNYKQALKLIKGSTPGLRTFKERLDIDDEEIDGWLAKERHFLEELKEEPEERILACAYVEALETRRKADDHWQAVSEEILNPPTTLVRDYSASVRWTSRVEASRRSAQEQITVAIRAVADLETRLLLKAPWTEDTLAYKDTVKYIRQRQYHRALDKLEQLVVQRLFELSKANVVGMGYKLRESVSRALKTRGKAIRTALTKYNTIAPKMDPPAPVLQWKQLMEYSFISEFELLKHAHSHHDITTEPWAVPLNREMALKHHKVKRAYEEIDRINHEAPRLRTSIRDEHQLYTHHIECLQESNPVLASELERVYAARRRVNNTHNARLDVLEALPGYSGRRGPGVRRSTPRMENTEGLRRGLVSDDGEEVPGDKASEEDAWRQGESSKDSTGHIEQDTPDDEIAEDLIELSAQFSADLRLVRGVPQSMLHQFAL